MKKTMITIAMMLTLGFALSGCKTATIDGVKYINTEVTAHESKQADVPTKTDVSGENENTANTKASNKKNSSEAPKNHLVLIGGQPILEGKYISIYDHHNSTIVSDSYDINKIRNYYEVEYNMYNDGTLVGKEKGKLVDGDYENELRVDFEKYLVSIAVYGDYNAMPRKEKRTTQIPVGFAKDIVNETNTRYDVSVKIKEIVEIDLDGDSAMEYIITVNDDKKFSASVLLNSAKEFKAYLSVLRDGKYMNNTTLLKEFHGFFIDVDNDNVMEIITNHVAYTTSFTTVSKFKNGEFIGVYNHIKKDYDRILEYTDSVLP